MGSEDESEEEGQGINRTKKVQKYLMKMRGTGSKEKIGKKEKKEKKEKVAGPPLSEEEKLQRKKEKKEAKEKKKEEDKERKLIAAARETKKLFGRNPLVIDDSDGEEEPERPDV